MSIITSNFAKLSDLGKQVKYNTSYDPTLLFPIPRAVHREEINLTADALPFVGIDFWNHYEVSWLNDSGKPMVARAQISYDCRSEFIVESKSLKLYFNSLNQTKFSSMQAVQQTVQQDLTYILGAPVQVSLHALDELTQIELPPGQCIDSYDVACEAYQVQPDYLQTEAACVEEQLYSNLLKSNCLVTQQPDWATLVIHYQGPKIQHQGLLRYIVSFRQHNEFHEHCIERIFNDIMQHCQPKKLTVMGFYTRRGGLDINPCRTTEANWVWPQLRLVRQ